MKYSKFGTFYGSNASNSGVFQKNKSGGFNKESLQVAQVSSLEGNTAEPRYVDMGI